MSLWVSIWALLISFISGTNVCKKPHIILITADDMGWNDVGFHGSNVMKTPNIDALAYYGIILNDFHSNSLCTPSRSALMTGEYPIHLGTQHSVILEAEPTGLRLDRKLLPGYLKDAGYRTHLIGKWHLGCYKDVYTPTKRGFQSFCGYWQGHQDYYTHYVEETFGGPFLGYDMRQDLKTDWEAKGHYSTDFFTTKAVDLIKNHNVEEPLFLYLSQIAPHAGAKNDPLQAPDEEVKKFDYIADPEKRKYVAMVSKLDECVGKVFEALKNKKMLENSIVIFMSDNGAPTVGIYATTGSNYPFRGIKSTEWEGGTRVPAIMWSPLFTKQQRVSNAMMHMVDILPTLCQAAGLDPKVLGKIDGISMWETLLNGAEKSPRSEFIYNIDPADKDNASGAIRINDWKYFQGNQNTTGPENKWYDMLDSESHFDDSSYKIDDVMNSLVSKSISTLQPANDFKHMIARFLGYLPLFPKCPTNNDLLTPQQILSLRKQAKIQCSKGTTERPACKPNEKPCLINLKEDPCERYNFADENPQQFKRMQELFEKYRREVVPPMNKPRDENADPARFNGVWANWGDFPGSSN